MSKSFGGVLVVMMTLVSPLRAQRLAPIPSPWTPLPVLLRPPTQATSVGDYRAAGTAIGSLLLGALGAYVGYQSCHNQPTPLGSGGASCTKATVTLGVVGAVVGGGVGFLVGRGTPRHRQ